jgi:signal transduction histidine kinase
LSTVQLNLQLLEEDIGPDNPAHSRIINRLHTVQRETTRLREILDDFLRYAGKIELNRQPIDLATLLEEVADFFAPQAQVNRVRLHVKPAAGPVMAWVDARLIKQAVLNLMINAVQAMHQEGGELIVSATLDGPQEARIDVIDTGPGIGAEAIKRIFHAYYSTKRGGTGLGLAMTRRIAEEHGGRVAVASEVGKGTDFTLHLPVGQAR